MRVLCVVFACLLAVSPAWAVYHGWGGTGQAGRLDDVANWGISASTFSSDDFHDPSKTVSGSENQCGGLPSGTYTIGADTYFNRMVMDQSGKAVNFDLGAHTLYLVGLDGQALGATLVANNATLAVTSGTLCVPLRHNGADATANAYVGLPRHSGDSTLHDATVWAQGTSAVLDLRLAKLNWGTNNVIGAVDGGTLKAYTNEMNVAAGSRSNRFYFARGGKLKNPYANPKPDQLSCNFTFSGTADGHRYEFADGGTQEGYERFAISGGTGFEVRFTGADTDVTFDTTNSATVLTMTGTHNLLTALDGAKLRVTNSLSSNGRARIWVNGDGNVIRSSGVGSLIQFFNAGNLIGQYGTMNHLVHVTDHGEMQMAGTRLGQGGKSKNEPAAKNRLLVEESGVFRDSSTLVVGYGDGFTCCSNRMDVLSGGTVYANSIQIGFTANAVENAADIGAGGTARVAGDMIVGYSGDRNALMVHDGGYLAVGGNLYVGYSGSRTNTVAFRDGARVTVGGVLGIGTANDKLGLTSGNLLTIASGAEVSANQFIVYSSNNCVKVENARVCVTNEATNAYGFQLPWYNDRDWNAHLILSGTNPVVRSMSGGAAAYNNYALGIRRGGKVTFVVPADGYREPPLQAPNGRIGFFDNGKGDVPDICFDLTNLKDGITETVLTRSKELYVSKSAMSRLQANLRSAVDARFGASTPCRVAAENGELRIRVGRRGLALIFR